LSEPYELAEPVGPVPHSLHKRSLELLLNKLDFKAKKLELKRQKLIKHFALKGKHHKGVFNTDVLGYFLPGKSLKT
jgi:hypothetical protein